MAQTAADMQANREKLDLARQAAQVRQGDMAARQRERQAAQAFKQSQPPTGRPGL